MSRVIGRLVKCIGVALTVTVLLSGSAQAQFGQNKITYHDHEWQVYESTHFDIHYYPETEPFLEQVVSYVESAYVDISTLLDHELRFRVPFIIYKTHGEFLQTNILLAELPDGVGAFAEPVQYRMVLPIDMPADELYKLISHELTHIFQYSMFYEGYLGRALRSRAPAWLIEGMASWVAQDESSLDQMAIRDAVVNNILPPIQQLEVVTYLTYRYGHAIFDFIEENHGIEGVRSFLFEFKKVLLTGNVGKALKEAFGYDVDEFNRRFNRYLRQRYFPILLEKKSPDEHGKEIAERKVRRGFTIGPAVSPSGELVATFITTQQELDLAVLSAEDGELIKNLTSGWTNKYRRLESNAFSGKRDISWSPVGDSIAVFARRENQWPLLIFNAVSGKIEHDLTLEDYFEAAAPAFSPDGTRVAFEANRDGVVDIFEVDIATGEVVNLTQDDFFDTNPSYSADGESLLYNRRIGDHWKIFSVDRSDSTRKTQITFGPHNDIEPTYSDDGGRIFFSSDRNEYDVYNIYALDLESGDITQYTDVVGGAFAPEQLADRDGESYLAYAAFFEGRFRLYRMPLRDAERVIPADERLSDVAEAAPFESQLKLRVDEEKKEPYNLKWDLESPGVQVGVADDGTFLGSANIGFTDLLGNHRASVTAISVDSFQSYQLSYLNVKRRYNWGASIYDFRDFVIVQDLQTGELDRRSQFKQTGASIDWQFPFDRYSRIESSVGYVDATSIATTPSGGLTQLEDELALVSVALVNDTTRYQSFGPFQGHRVRFGSTYGAQIDGTSAGDQHDYQLDYRGYWQMTRRSLFALRVAGLYNTGEREPSRSFGGINQLRGYDYRDFLGSNIAWMNLEYRFPLVDELRFPILSLFQIRGFFFLDVGTAWFGDDAFYDPELGGIIFPGIVPDEMGYEFWDDDNDRLADGRGSYGVGLQFFFLGGLQFNWSFSERLSHTQRVLVFDPVTGSLTDIERVERKSDGKRTDFYIAFDW